MKFLKFIRPETRDLQTLIHQDHVASVKKLIYSHSNKILLMNKKQKITMTTVQTAWKSVFQII